MSDKINWMLEELHEDEFNVTALAVERILNGDTEAYEDALVDYVMELNAEWEAQ